MPESSDSGYLTRTLEAAVRLGALLLLAAWCFQIVQPFVIPVVWGAILAVLLYPAYRWVCNGLGGRRALTAALFTILALVILLTPTAMFATTLVSFTRDLVQELNAGTLSVPPPPESVGALPIIGESLETFWLDASTNLEGALRQLAPQIGALLQWILSTAVGTGLGILQFTLSIVISGVFLARAEAAEAVSRTVGTRLAGTRGIELVDLAGATLRSVARGILGVALIQSLLAGAGFVAVGVPGAGLWVLLCLLLAIVQLPPGLVLIPVALYVLSTAGTVTGVLFLIWSIFVSILDNFLKPLLLGRGLEVPMLVIFVGAIGGFLASGFLGLFVGSIVLAIGYELLVSWLAESPEALETAGASPAPAPGAS